MQTDITGREYGVIYWLSYGYSNPEIASELEIAPNTVKKYVEKISKKLSANGRAGIVGEAFRKGILNQDGKFKNVSV